MTEKGLFRAIGLIDDDLIAQAEGRMEAPQIKSRPAWGGRAAMASMACAAAVLVFIARVTFFSPNGGFGDRTQEHTSSGQASSSHASSSLSDGVMGEGQPSFVQNKAAGKHAAPEEGLIKQPLAKEELARLMSGYGEFYLTGADAYFNQEGAFSHVEIQIRLGESEALIRLAPERMGSLYTFDGEPVASDFLGVPVTAGYWEKDGTTEYFACFLSGGAGYTAEISGSDADTQKLVQICRSLIEGDKPDFSMLKRKQEGSR